MSKPVFPFGSTAQGQPEPEASLEKAMTNTEMAFVSSVRRFVALAARGLPTDCWLDALMTHPHYPNVLAVLDAVRVAGIECEAVRGDFAKIAELSRPSLLYIRSGSGNFAVLEDVTADRVLWSHPDSGRGWVSRRTVEEYWTGIAVVVQRIVSADEHGDCHPRRVTRAAPILTGLLAASLIGIALATGTRNSLVVATLLCQIVGAAVSLILASSKDDLRLAPVLCPAGTVFDCRRVLTSRASSILGVSLSDWAAAWFIAGAVGTVAGLLAGSPSSLIRLLAWTSAITVPIAIASVIYQVTIIRALCAGCLIIDAMLLVQAAMLWPYRAPIDGIGLRLAAFGLWTAAALIAALHTRERAGRDWRWQLFRLKRNPDVLAALIAKAAPVAPPGHSPRLSFGQANAPIDVTLVMSPYCPACATVHGDLPALARSAGMRVTLLFICDTQQDVPGVRLVVAAHALAQLGRTHDAHSLLESWFGNLAAGRSYDDTRLKDLYTTLPADAISAARSSLREQLQWSVDAVIAATPAVLVQHRLLPSHYLVSDLAGIDTAALAVALARLTDPPAAGHSALR